MAINHHGGQCCGITHIYGFSSHSENIVGLRGERLRAGHLYEVALTDQQLEYPRIVKWLKDHHFYLVNRFRNSNSRNFVNVFHRTGGKYGSCPEDSPWWKMKEEV